MEQVKQYFYVVFSEKEWEDFFSVAKWDYGDNDHKTRYENIREATEGDIILCSYKQKIVAIGEAYNHNDKAHTYFKVIAKPETIKPFSLKYIKKETGIEIKTKKNKREKCLKLDAERIKVAQWIQQCYEQHKEIPFEINMEDKMSHSNTNPKAPLNQILYGPPGTGKTYHTIDKALEILLEHKEIESNPENREEKKKIFDEFKKKRQIEFITFHQSYSYEEFVEGIKPKMNNNSSESNSISYEIKSGIFKQICEKTQEKTFVWRNGESNNDDCDSISISISENTRVWKISLKPKEGSDAAATKELQDYCFKNNEIRIGWGKDGLDKTGKIVTTFIDKIQIGDLVCILKDKDNIQAIGVIKSELMIKDDEIAKKYDFYRSREVTWIDKNDHYVKELNDGISLTSTTCYELSRIKPSDIVKLIDKGGQFKAEQDNTQKPYILVIDEINRGNISKILGELITLIEPSKRIGAPEELRVTLPYSQDQEPPFGVPKNLYIIGTMNTADRSIALLDTALRRRFDFIEMMPKHDILKLCGNVDLKQLLKKMNDRIEFLLDREHTIGHAFFIGIESIDELQQVFAKKIIPLLQEYFYDDYAKIHAVLNDNGMIESKSMKDLGITMSDELMDSEKKIYRITASSEWQLWQFVKIYDDKKAKELEEASK